MNPFIFKGDHVALHQKNRIPNGVQFFSLHKSIDRRTFFFFFFKKKNSLKKLLSSLHYYFGAWMKQSFAQHKIFVTSDLTLNNEFDVPLTTLFFGSVHVDSYDYSK